MKKLVTFILVAVSCFSVHAQLKTNPGMNRLFGFFRMKQSLSSLDGIRSTPRFTSIPSGIRMTTTSYWEGLTYTNFSENGRLSSTYSFDMQGQLRETRTSILLRKSGAFSNWTIQFAPQRSNKALFVYRIQ